MPAGLAGCRSNCSHSDPRGRERSGSIPVMRTELRLVLSAAESLSHLVDAVPESLRDSAHDRPPDLTGGHLPQLYGRGLAVERGVRSHNQVGSILQRGVT